MPTSFTSFDALGAVRIEVEGAREGFYGTNLARTLQIIVATVTDTIGKIPEEQRPQEISLNCGLKAVDSGKFAISLGADATNFTLSLIWRSENTQGLAGAGLMPSETQPGT